MSLSCPSTKPTSPVTPRSKFDSHENAILCPYLTSNRVALYAWYYVAWAVGNIIGPQTFRANQAPAYTGGTIAMIVCYVIAIILILVYGFISHRENKQREADIQNGAVTADGQDWLDLTDQQNRSFKYTT